MTRTVSLTTNETVLRIDRNKTIRCDIIDILSLTNDALKISTI